MELELKHLSPYLPFKLQIKILNPKNDYVGIEFAVVNGFYMIGDSIHLTYEGGSTGKDVTLFKPILRPLSDLCRGEEVNHTTQHKINTRLGGVTETRYLSDHLFSHYQEYLSVSTKPGDGVNRLYIPFSVFETIKENLLKDHFDLFGLIQAGLAIDINTLKQD